jgi:hypothetical protein
LTVGTAIRLEALSRNGFDARLARLGGGKLTRAAAATYLESDRGFDDASHQLALAGIRVTRCSEIPALATGLRPAIAFDLVPLDGALQVVDVVEVRQIPLSEASVVLMRPRLRWLPGSRAARDACRRLLRDEDAVLGWRRTVWCSVASLRAARARVRLRPVVFDRAAVDRHPLRWTYVNDAAIEHWAFA